MPAHFWESDEMRRALATRHMGKIARAFRTHAYGRPISQSVAASWFFLTQAQLSRIESGPPIQNIDRLVQWAHILRIPANLLWFPLTHLTEPSAAGRCASGVFAGAPETGCPMGVPSPSQAPEPARRLPRDDDEWRQMAELSRATFVKRGVGAVTLPAIGLDELQHIAIALTDARRYADDAVVGYFRRQLEECSANDRRRGPKRSIPVIIGMIAAVEQLAREAKAPIRHELLRTGSRAAELAGWFYRDITMPELANYWRDRAVEWAQATNDSAMQGYVLLKKSQAAWDDRDGLRMLTMARAAQEGPWRLPPHVLAEAAQQEARALAMIGHPFDLVEHRLDEARALLARHDPARLDPDAWLSPYYDEALFNLQLAICYEKAGRPARALDLYDAWLTPVTFSARDYGYFLSLKGLTYAAAEEPDEAATAGLRALALARETSSARTHQEVLRLAGLLRLWRDRASVGDLCGALLA
ncbi:MAG TPA: XRE family transcriptional regulator [Streptosporangiaceae bacterium]|nr:XRE family transcriptional regulator [Streptosporangiaceae bacterium]